MADLGPFAGALMELLGPALGVLLRTTLGMALLTVVLMGTSFRLAAAGSTVRGLLAVLLTLVIGAVMGAMLAVKRAVLVSLRRGVEKLDLGQRTLRLVFDKLLGVEGGGAVGERGGAVARLVERLPLAQAEVRLRAAVDGLLATPEGGSGGWLRQRLKRLLLEKLQDLTLSRFRAADQQAGGVDLIHVRDELSGQINTLIGDQIGGLLTRVTVIFALLAAALSLVGAYLIRQLPF